jgi:hypothetical protein
MICKIRGLGRMPLRSLPTGFWAAMAFLLVLLISHDRHCFSHEHGLSMPQMERRVLEASGEIEDREVSESSGLVKSRKWPDVFWTLNDSSNGPKIFAIRKNGSCIKPSGGSDCSGIEILGAKNDDWEDIALDNKGSLIIADLGDNLNERKNLALYVLDEPNPYKAKRSGKAVKIRVEYPDKLKIPPDRMNFDCEAVVWAKEKLFFLTKHRSDDFTKLYRLDSMNPKAVNRLILVDKFPIGGMVTGADASPDGRKLVVLPYGAVWLFEERGKCENWFQGKIRWLPIQAGQCEGIAFDGDKLIITNEQRQCFELPIENLLTVRE